MNYNLEDRTAVFGENIIEFVKSLSNSDINYVLIKQITRSATSIGANYMEADAAESKKDFQHKISVCKKESKETKHWLRMLLKACPKEEIKIRELSDEINQLIRIFSKIIITSKNKEHL